MGLGLNYFKFNQANISNDSLVSANQIAQLSEVQNNYVIAYGVRLAHHF